MKWNRSLRLNRIAKFFISFSLSIEVLGCATPRPIPPPRLRGFNWPLQNVEITSPFGKRGKDFHEGLDLRAPTGTPVFASQSGVVLYAGQQIRGYGKLVVVRHPGRIATLYAHNSKLLVRHGQQVRQGEKICISGATGHVSGPHLHFEIRKGLSPLNPLPYLPMPEKAQPVPVLTKTKSPLKPCRRRRAISEKRNKLKTRVHPRLARL